MTEENYCKVTKNRHDKQINKLLVTKTTSEWMNITESHLPGLNDFLCVCGSGFSGV